MSTRVAQNKKTKTTTNPPLPLDVRATDARDKAFVTFVEKSVGKNIVLQGESNIFSPFSEEEQKFFKLVIENVIEFQAVEIDTITGNVNNFATLGELDNFVKYSNKANLKKYMNFPFCIQRLLIYAYLVNKAVYTNYCATLDAILSFHTSKETIFNGSVKDYVKTMLPVVAVSPNSTMHFLFKREAALLAVIDEIDEKQKQQPSSSSNAWDLLKHGKQIKSVVGYIPNVVLSTVSVITNYQALPYASIFSEEDLKKQQNKVDIIVKYKLLGVAAAAAAGILTVGTTWAIKKPVLARLKIDKISWTKLWVYFPYINWSVMSTGNPGDMGVMSLIIQSLFYYKAFDIIVEYFGFYKDSTSFADIVIKKIGKDSSPPPRLKTFDELEEEWVDLHNNLTPLVVRVNNNYQLMGGMPNNKEELFKMIKI